LLKHCLACLLKCWNKQ